MTAKAISYATANIVSTEEKGAAFTIDIPAKVNADLSKNKKIAGISPDLKKIAKDTLKFLGHSEYGLKIKIENKIPFGLGKEEALSLALIFAIAGAIAKKHGSVNELKIDKYWQEQFFIVDGKVIDKRKLLTLCPKKLNFSRVAASFYGGFAITDNKEREILRRGEMEDFSLKLKKLKIKKKKPSQEKLFQNELTHAWKEALKGNLYEAMKINSLIHNQEETEKMLKKGALTASFSPPYILGLLRDSKKETIKTINQGVKILQKPKKIYRTKEFLELGRSKKRIQGIG